MTDYIQPLAIVGGFWGQVFEYWPFSLTVAFTLVFGSVTLIADLVWRREVPPPAGAMPRIFIPVDPRLVPRLWIKRGLTLLRFGYGLGIFIGFLFVSFAVNPPGAGAMYGLEVDANNAFAFGAGIAFGASILGYWATVILKRHSWQMVGVLGVTGALVLLGPLLTTGETRWFGVGVVVMGFPIIFTSLGLIYTIYGLKSSQAAFAAIKNDVGDGVLRGSS